MKSKLIDISNWEGFSEYEKSQIDSDAYAWILKFLIDEGYDITHPHCKYYEEKYIKAYTNLFFAKNNLIAWIKEQDKNIVRWKADFKIKIIEVFYE